MSQDERQNGEGRRLHLVDGDQEAPASEDARADRELAALLKAAADPMPLGAVDHEALLALTLGDDVFEVDDAERAAAESLRLALDGEGDDPLAELAQALRAARCEDDLDELTHARLVREALEAAELEEAPAERAPAAIERAPDSRRVTPGSWVAGLAAVAAVAALFLGGIRTTMAPKRVNQPSPVAAASLDAALKRSRSTAELFDPAVPFPRQGEESARVDRIARARASDLRANRFAAWGVR